VEVRVTAFRGVMGVVMGGQQKNPIRTNAEVALQQEMSNIERALSNSPNSPLTSIWLFRWDLGPGSLAAAENAQLPFCDFDFIEKRKL
jgi:hypothetical protein